ncbi:hypothetical protein PIB30_009762 [Stylosanthes scabra]|uniref:Uncharacterized protein n=1 Tax=Stylosanthes scabra TaxID=79078 RepID=A0ABU6X519_9FABA|nr:hypothetical protein [Stylosanthes scabra]
MPSNPTVPHKTHMEAETKLWPKTNNPIEPGDPWRIGRHHESAIAMTPKRRSKFIACVWSLEASMEDVVGREMCSDAAVKDTKKEAPEGSEEDNWGGWIFEWVPVEFCLTSLLSKLRLQIPTFHLLR